MASGSGSGQDIPEISARLDQTVCQEILSEAQGLVTTQLGSAESLASKLSNILAQATTLAIAAFGAAALAVPSGSTAPWMPAWGAAGFGAAGVIWVVTAFKAAKGLQPREWQAGFSPRKLWTPKILNAPSAAEALLYIAVQTQGLIDENDRLNTEIAAELMRAQQYFTRALPIGIGVAAVALLLRLFKIA